MRLRVLDPYKVEDYRVQVQVIEERTLYELSSRINSWLKSHPDIILKDVIPLRNLTVLLVYWERTTK